MRSCPPTRKWLGHALEDPIGDQRRVALVADILEQHDELVPAEASDRVPWPQEPSSLRANAASS